MSKPINQGVVSCLKTIGFFLYLDARSNNYDFGDVYFYRGETVQIYEEHNGYYLVSVLTMPDLRYWVKASDIIVSTDVESKLLAVLAKNEHDRWSHWMKYLFTKGSVQPDGSFVIPEDLVKRWTRQMHTEYQDLSEKEKESDIDGAREILQKIKGILPNP